MFSCSTRIKTFNEAKIIIELFLSDSFEFKTFSKDISVFKVSLRHSSNPLCVKSVRINTNLGCKVVTHCWFLVSSKQYGVTGIIWDFERADSVDNEIQVYCLEIKYALRRLNHDHPEFVSLTTKDINYGRHWVILRCTTPFKGCVWIVEQLAYCLHPVFSTFL